MSRRTKHKIILTIWLAVFFLLGFGVWGFQAGHLMLAGYVFLSALMYVFYAFLVRCPECRVPILLRPFKILGVEIYLWSILAPERCRHCGVAL
jgi:hypothetical protein